MYVCVVVGTSLQKPEAKDTYWATHGTKESANGRNGGAHFDYLEALLAKSGGSNGFFVGGQLSAADLCVWEIVDLHLRIFKEQMEATVRRRGERVCLHLCVLCVRRLRLGAGVACVVCEITPDGTHSTTVVCGRFCWDSGCALDWRYGACLCVTPPTLCPLSSLMFLLLRVDSTPC